MVVPDAIDVEYIKKFKEFILKRVEAGERFALCIGGGKTSRRYQQALTNIGNTDVTDNHWMGTLTCTYNAHLIRLAFKPYSYKETIDKLDKIKEVDDSPIVVIGAEAPGHSSDFDAVVIAELLGAKRIAILSNIDYVYDSDPKFNPEAKKFEDIEWNTYLSFIPEEHAPNMSVPIDPVAARRARDNDLEVATMKGSDIESLEKYLDGDDSFVGTRVHN